MCFASLTGPNDCVRCYQCGGGMKNWQPGDVPVAEHALWFPTCEFILDVINRNDVSVEDETRGACGGPGKDVYLKDFTTSENENLAATSEDHNIPVVSEIQINQESKLETTKPQPKDSNKDMIIRENEELKEQLLCKICMDNDADVVFLPCGHMVACTTCARALRKCAVCRALIKSALKSFRT